MSPSSLVQNNRIQVTLVKLPLRSLRMREGSDFVTHQKNSRSARSQRVSDATHCEFRSDIFSTQRHHIMTIIRAVYRITKRQLDEESNSDKDHFSSYTRYILLRCRLFKNNENGSSTSKRYITISNKVTEQHFHCIRQVNIQAKIML